MSTTSPRKPAVSRPHPAAELPSRESVSLASVPVPSPVPEAQEGLTATHNVRIRPSVKHRLNRAVDKLRYETGDRSISIASLTDEAIAAYLDSRGC